MAPLISVGFSSFLGLLVGLAVIVGLVWQGAGRSLDKKWSTTNIQIILWTGVILGSYFALCLSAGSFLTSFPTNTLVLIGITSGTLAFSSTIRSVQENGSDNKSGAGQSTGFLGGFVASEKNPDQPSIAKIQMFAWNIVAMLLFVVFVGTNLNHANYTLPDIGATLSTIIGISNGANVAVKVTDTPSPSAGQTHTGPCKAEINTTTFGEEMGQVAVSIANTGDCSIKVLFQDADDNDRAVQTVEPNGKQSIITATKVKKVNITALDPSDPTKKNPQCKCTYSINAE
jgi:hypothetical protein